MLRNITFFFKFKKTEINFFYISKNIITFNINFKSFYFINTLIIIFFYSIDLFIIYFDKNIRIFFIYNLKALLINFLFS
jgi:hypothetical protein